MNTHLHVLPDADSFVRAAGEFWCERAKASVALHERFAVALAGGGTPRMLYRYLATQRAVAWEQIWFYFGDERCVHADHPDSNYRLARETLLEQVPVVPEHVHPMHCSDDPQRAAEDYTALLAPLQPAANLPPVLDLIMLGLGTDGHTASLFPNSPLLGDHAHWVAAVLENTPDHPRLTLTLPTLNAERTLMFFVSGKDKAKAVRDTLKGGDVPAARLLPQGEVHWFLDAAAATEI